ncbi:hypothetical protein V5O48_008818 [Marasmius crinis-equi]|uniref:Protein kinase domain-containing protein n=1 Tax=Marasmius crinis-equi TaxID=585013 RepID=A0ABR3FDC6_9AGAR
MSSDASGTSAPQGGGRSALPATEEAKQKAVSPTLITLIKPQATDGLLDNTPEKFKLVVKSRRGETIKEQKWDSERGGWPVDIVQIRGQDTENLSIELQKPWLIGHDPRKIGGGLLTLKEVELALHASQDRLGMTVSQSSSSINENKLVLIVGISTPLLVPLCITSISLAESSGNLTDEALENLELVFTSRQEERLKKSMWNSSHRCWDVDLPQLQGEATEELSIELRRKRRVRPFHKMLTTVTLNIKEGEQALRNELKKGKQHSAVRKTFVIPPNNGLDVEEMVLDIHFSPPAMLPSITEPYHLSLSHNPPPSNLTSSHLLSDNTPSIPPPSYPPLPALDIKDVVLPRSAAQIVKKTLVISEVLEKLSGMLQKKHELDEQLLDLIDSMNQLYGCATVQDGLKNYATFHVLFDAMIQQTVECFLFISNYISDGYFRETCSTFVPAANILVLMRSLAGHMTTVSDKIDRFKSSFENLKNHFNNDLLRTSAVMAITTKDLVVGLHESMDHLDQKLDLQDMKRVLEQKLGTTEYELPSDLPRCLLGTRQHTLSKILDWIICGKESLLWLSGVAGSGKSSVMATLHDYLKTMGCSSHLAAYIRFRRSHFETPSKFVQALIYQLAQFDSSLGALIAQAMKDDSILSLPLSHQLQSLFIQPLKMHKPDIKEQTQIVVLIDGLDECMQEAGGSDAFHNLLALLAHLGSPETFHSFPFLRIIVASRPEEPIYTAFTKMLISDSNLDDLPNILHFRLDTSSSETTADILKYLTVSFEEIFRKNHRFRELCQQKDAVSHLAKSSHGLFIWAYAISRFLGDFPSEERLQSALDMIVSKDSPGGAVLSNLYPMVLNGVAAGNGDEDVKSDIRSLIGLVIAVGRVKADDDDGDMPMLTTVTLHGLLQHLTGSKADDILSLLPRLGAVIEGVHSPNAELFLLHKSLEDYLTDANRAGDAWYIDVKGHWIPKVAECFIQMVHSNVFSDADKTSDTLSVAYSYWTWAFTAQLDQNHPFSSECVLSRMFLDILQQGFLRWVQHNSKRADDGDTTVFHLTYSGLNHMRKTIIQTPKIVGEVAETLRWLKFGAGRSSPSNNLEIIFLSFCLHPGVTPTLCKWYLPRFSNMASGSRDFRTILSAIENNTNASTVLYDRLRLTDEFTHDSGDDFMVLQINGIPPIDVLEEMIKMRHEGRGLRDIDINRQDQAESDLQQGLPSDSVSAGNGDLAVLASPTLDIQNLRLYLQSKERFEVIEGFDLPEAAAKKIANILQTASLVSQELHAIGKSWSRNQPEADYAYRKRCIRYLQQIYEKNRVLPDSLFANGIRRFGERFDGGGYSVSLYTRAKPQGVLILMPAALSRIFIEANLTGNKLHERDEPGLKLKKQGALYKEALVWAQLIHSNVLPFYGVNKDLFPRHDLCLVSPWMVNGEIMPFLIKNPDHDRLRVVQEIAAGIEYLHSLQIVHGDIKPVRDIELRLDSTLTVLCGRKKNILVDEQGRCYLADFGLAAAVVKAAPELNTVITGTHKGTTPYMAPELFTNFGPRMPDNFPADIYAYGCTVYEVQNVLCGLLFSHELTGGFSCR